MEAATGRPGSPATPGGRAGVDLALLALVAVLLIGSVGGGVLVWQARDVRADAATEQQQYGAVLAAARAEVDAFINIRYDDAQASIDQVAAGATGEFREQYTSSSERVIEELVRDESVMEGAVLHAGVVSLDEGSATVIVATVGTIATRQTDHQPVERDFRLRLELVLDDGRWLTDDLQFVGEARD